ncbi:hypothetical protein [uncultured Friedmanniella sp.]|uniref:hypothetical protein n=1 Tax=uncultured Friedmanniella sp. TaxID=335381 RepID=UPI0035CBEDE3
MHLPAPTRPFPVAELELTDRSYPCDCGTCPRFIYFGSFCASCLVHCELDAFFPQEPVDFGALFPQTPAHDAITEAAAERFLSEVA